MLETVQVVLLVKKDFFETRRGVLRIWESYANARRFNEIFLWPMRACVLSQIFICSFTFKTLLISAGDNDRSSSRALLTFWLWRWIHRASKWRFAMWNMSVTDERSDDYQLWPSFLPRMYRGAFTKVWQSNAGKLTTEPW